MARVVVQAEKRFDRIAIRAAHIVSRAPRRS